MIFKKKLLRMIEINEFIKKLAEELESISADEIKPETNLRSLPQWSSMYALIIIALIDTEYNVTITGEDLIGLQSVQELFDLVVSRQ